MESTVKERLEFFLKSKKIMMTNLMMNICLNCVLENIKCLWK